MKKTKILVPAMAVLALGMAAAVTGTVAWFSANNTVQASGMQFKSVTPSSLAIGKQHRKGAGIGDATSVEFTDAAKTLNPCSHWNTRLVETVETSAEDSTGLYYAPDRDHAQFIDPDKGLAAANDTPVANSNPASTLFNAYEQILFTQVNVEGENGYYVDYVVYIGSVGTSITLENGGKLTANVTYATGLEKTQLAATVDFFVARGTNGGNAGDTQVNPTTGSFVQGVNAIGQTYVGHHATYSGEGSATTTAKVSSDVLEYNAVTPVTIPAADSDDYLAIIMRFYFDGALLEDATHTYVRSNSLNTSAVGVTVSFTLNRGSNA